jgi:enoyl-CoA hydratase/carnithine racemase
MPYHTITATTDTDGCAVITLNHPERRNAISILMRQEISACLAAWQDDASVGCVIVTGADKTFSAGFDLDEFRQVERHEDLLASSSRYHRDLWHFPKPTIAAVNGPAMGGGFDLACLCDLRLAATTASFGHPEVKFGAPPLYTPLRWLVGDGHARELCLTGRRIDAAEALRIGLAIGVEAPDRLLERARQLATTVLEAPADALRYLKGTFTAGSTFEDAFALEHDRAFREVILPRFSG